MHLSNSAKHVVLFVTADRRDDINQLKVELNTEIGLMEREIADLAVKIET